jgi:hypothetical protein
MKTIDENNIFYDENEEPIIISKPVMDLLLKQENRSELISLYLFYYYTAKWQKTNQPYALTSFVAKGLNWGIDKVKKYKGKLLDLRLIQDVIHKNANGKIQSHYIRVNFIWSKEKVNELVKRKRKIEIIGVNKMGQQAIAFNHQQQNTIGGKIPSVVKNGINTLSTNNKNALSTNNKNNSFFSKNLTNEKERITPNDFDKFWIIYPKKTDKGKALTSWNKICTRKNHEPPTWSEIKTAIINQKETSRWKKGFIPLPTTWLNQSRWLDDPNEMKDWNDKSNNSSWEPEFVK